MKLISTLKLFIAIAAITIMSACSHTTRLVETKANNASKMNDNSVTFENDSIRVTYDLWSESGIMFYSVYNKTNMPLYIDWKRSAYVEENRIFPYYNNRSVAETQYIPTVNGNTVVMTPRATTVSEERITFIPPRTLVTNPITWKIFSGGMSTYSSKNKDRIRIETVDLKNDKNATLDEAPKTYTKGNKGTSKVYSKTFTKDQSPLLFRNYISYSAYEDFRKESHLETEFYISKLSEMDTRQFNGKGTPGTTVVRKGTKVSTKKTIFWQYPYRVGDAFYQTLN